MPQPHRTANEDRGARLISMLAPMIQSVPRDQVGHAPYAIRAEVPAAQHRALIDHALELGGPPGMVIGRRINTPGEHTVEILVGWDRLQAFLHHDAFPRATSLPIGIIDCNAAEAAFYAIEFAAKDHVASGLVSTPLLYASAAQTALEHFGEDDRPWTIQALANALSIARPTLSNRLRLLRCLAPKARKLLQQGLIKPEMAKILLGEPSVERQEHLATLAAKGMMSTRALYRLVHPSYEPPQVITQPRGDKKKRRDTIDRLERSYSEHYGIATTITLDTKSQKSRVTMAFDNLLDLKRLLETLAEQTTSDTAFGGHLTFSSNNTDETQALLRALEPK